MAKVITLSLGGQDRHFCFSKLGFLKWLGEISKSDPIDFFNTDMTADPSKSYKACFYIIYAGLMCQSMQNGKETFTPEQVDQWVQGLETSEVSGIITEAVYAMAGQTAPVGEPVAQANQLSGTS